MINHSNINSAPIGVFDSGIGGLTTFKRLVHLLPNEDVIFFGDTGRVPYGSRSRETIIKYTRQCTQFLVEKGVKAIILACNTSSSMALETLTGEFDLPLFGVVSPPARIAAETTKNRRVGVIGTVATISSGAYETALHAIDPKLFVTCAACPLFVPLVENGRTAPDDVAVMAIAGDYLKPVLDTGIDTLILGCTHYPHLEAAIAKITGPDITLVDSGAETAEYAAKYLAQAGLLTDKTAPGFRRYYVTDSVTDFEAQVSRFLEADVHGLVTKITLE